MQVTIDGENYIAEASLAVDDEKARLQRIEAKLQRFIEMTMGCTAEQLQVTGSVVPDMVVDVSILMLILGGEWRERGKTWREQLKRD